MLQSNVLRCMPSFLQLHHLEKSLEEKQTICPGGGQWENSPVSTSAFACVPTSTLVLLPGTPSLAPASLESLEEFWLLRTTLASWCSLRFGFTGWRHGSVGRVPYKSKVPKTLAKGGLPIISLGQKS